MTRVYDSSDNVVRYTWWEDLFGPKVTQDEIDALEFRAITEGWDEWFYHVVRGKKARKRRWILAFLRDHVIEIRVAYVDLDDPAYIDDDPFENRD